MQFKGLIYNVIQKNQKCGVKQEIRMDIFRKEYGHILVFVRTKNLFCMDDESSLKTILFLLLFFRAERIYH
jgi:hypothetical protein